MIVYEIKRGSVVLASVKPTGAREERIMAGDVVNMSFNLNHYVDFIKGDTAIVDGELFILQKPSDFEQQGAWTYNLKFLKDGELSEAGILALDENNEFSEYDCFYTGNASNAVDLIIANANRISPGFTKGTVDETEVKDFDFTGDNCATALAKLSNAYDIEFWVENKKVHLTKKGADSGLSFRRGKGKGLLKLIRRTQDNKPVTRLHVYGSKQNLSAEYSGLSKRLRMPGGQKYIQDQTKVDKYGLIEESILLDEIFPKRVGTVTAVAGALTFTDSAIDFDLNAHLVDKVAAKVKFTTGRLAGYQFEIKEKGYNHSTKTITILINKDETAMEVPSAANGMVPVIGDQYILIDVIMPQIDITKAEIELKAKATEKYYESSDPRVIFDAPTDRRYLREFNIFVKLGDFVTIQARDANIDQRIRVISKTTNLQDKWDINLELSESVSVAGIVKQLIAESNIQKAVKNAKITDVARQRLMWRTTTELTTMLDTLRAEMLLIMVKGGNYQTDIQVETSVDQDSNKFTTSTGSVEHQEYIENGGHWNVSAFSGLLPTAAAYYVYIKASRTSTAATVIYSLNKIDVDTDPLNYYFPFGIISSVIDGTRVFSTTKGFTVITGNNIKTGIIEGPSGELIINMETGEIFGKITFKGSNGGIKDLKNVDDTANLAIDNAAAADGKAITAQTAADIAKVKADSAQGTANGAITNAAAAQLSADAAKTIADNAQSLANSKNRNFVIQPFTPYDIGDFWTNETDLFRCTVARGSGVFVAADWTKATVYDSTQVTIDNGVVTGGTVQLGNTGGINAGITGAGGLATDIRFWAGSSFANRDIAPFRVDQSGKVWMSNANVGGILNAGPGSKIGDVMIDAAGKFNLAGSKVEVIPDQLIRVYNGGAADFSEASKMVIPTTGSRKWKIYIDEVGAGGGAVAPPVISSLWDLTNTFRTGSEQNNQALLFDLATGKWTNKTINVDVDLTAYAKKDGSNASGTWGINVSGTSALSYNSAQWNGYDFDKSNAYGSGFDLIFGRSAGINEARLITQSGMQNYVGTNNGSTLSNSISGNANSASKLNNGSSLMTFHWQGQAGQPTWVWGANGFADAYVYNPSNFNVNSAVYWGGRSAELSNSSALMFAPVVIDGLDGKAKLGVLAQFQNYLNVNNGFTLNNNINGSANAAKYWGVGSTGQAEYSGTPSAAVNTFLLGFSADSKWAPQSATNVRLWLGSPAAGETLPSILARGYTASQGQVLALRATDPGNGYFELKNALNSQGSAYRLVSGVWGWSQDGFSIFNSRGITPFYIAESGNTHVGYTSDQGYNFAVNGTSRFNGGVIIDGGITINSIGTFAGDVTAPIFRANNWFRSSGGTGWYNEDYQGGIHMNDSTWVRVYNSKGLWADNQIRGTEVISHYNGFKSNNFTGLAGDYEISGTTDKIVWTIGSSWNTLESMYGIGYSFRTKYVDGNHQIVFRQAGAVHAAINLDTGAAHFDGTVTAPIVKATSKLFIPSTSGKQWSLYIQDN